MHSFSSNWMVNALRDIPKVMNTWVWSAKRAPPWEVRMEISTWLFPNVFQGPSMRKLSQNLYFWSFSSPIMCKVLILSQSFKRKHCQNQLLHDLSFNMFSFISKGTKYIFSQMQLKLQPLLLLLGLWGVSVNQILMRINTARNCYVIFHIQKCKWYFKSA